MSKNVAGRARLSVCMIVKDEESVLARSIESVRDIADEIVVVDTGSSDQTRKVAEGHGAKVFFHKWEESFAEARNVSLDKATSEWVLILDADEELVEGAAPKLRDILKDSKSSAFFLQVADDTVPDWFPSLRLWRNKSAYRYQGRVHERPVFGDDLPSDFFTYTSVQIIHHGYGGEADMMENKNLRNEALVKKALLENPKDPGLLFYEGRARDAENQLEEAASFYRRACENDREGNIGVARRNYASVLERQGQYHKAVTLLRKSVDQFPDYVDLWYLLGLVRTRLNDFESAIKAFERAISLAGVPRYPTRTGVGSFLAWRGIASCFLNMRQPQAAAEALGRALEANPRDEVALKNLGQILLKSYSPAEVQKRLQPLVDTSDARIQMCLHELFGEGYS